MVSRNSAFPFVFVKEAEAVEDNVRCSCLPPVASCRDEFDVFVLLF